MALPARRVPARPGDPGSRRPSPLWLAFSALTVVVHLILRSWRWRTLLRSVRAKIPYRELLSATSIGYMASLLPGRVGEVLRPALLARRADLPFPPALATVGVERAVLDLLAVLAFGAAALVLPAGVSGLSAGADPLLLARLRVAGGAVLAGALVALVLTMLLARHRESVGAWLETRRQTMGRLPRLVTGWLASLLPGLATFSTMRGALRLAWGDAAGLAGDRRGHPGGHPLHRRRRAAGGVSADVADPGRRYRDSHAGGHRHLPPGHDARPVEALRSGRGGGPGGRRGRARGDLAAGARHGRRVHRGRWPGPP
ncbi:MAG: lysylphosphatidylglycerol synthase transmembrane domain-containing protein [Acidobacteriota bacterium]|nr:lysylphosphatidylglycerol synthase transmembrane domain-containing protein [Acidobacteriota bacterium]